MELTYGRISERRTAGFAVAAGFATLLSLATFVLMCVGGGIHWRWVEIGEYEWYALMAVSLVLCFIVLRRARSSSPVWRRVAKGCVAIVILQLVGLGTMIAVCWNNPTQAEYREILNCSREMRDIALGLDMYANVNGGRYPATLDELNSLGLEYQTPFQCPTGGGYHFVVAGLSRTADPNLVMVYETPANHRSGMHVLFQDGRVKFMSIRESRRIIPSLSEH